jgi:hypothetical protein
MQILTNTLTREQFRQELSDVCDFLAGHGVVTVGVSFGFTVECPDLDDVGEQHPVPVLQVVDFVAERERTKGFELGSDDCWLSPQGLEAEFLFCNDRDVHLTSDSEEIVDAMRMRWRPKGFSVYPDDLPLDA